MFSMIWLRKKLFGTRFAAFQFGFETHISKIRTDANGEEFAFCYGTLIALNDHKKWREL